MQESVDWRSALEAALPALQSAGSVVVSIISGAGGAALLDLFWKPRQARRRAATILLSEVLNNTQLCLLQANARWRDTKKVPADFRMELQGWDAAQDKLAELPPDAIKSVMLLYSRFRALNEAVHMFGDLLDRFEDQQEGSSQRRSAERALVSAIDVFNTSLDKTIEHAKALLPDLLKLSGVEERPPRAEELRDYAADVDEFLQQREARIQTLLDRHKS